MISTILERISKNATKKGDCLIARYKPTPNGYGLVDINGKKYLLHRVVFWIYSNIKI